MAASRRSIRRCTPEFSRGGTSVSMRRHWKRTRFPRSTSSSSISTRFARRSRRTAARSTTRSRTSTSAVRRLLRAAAKNWKHVGVVVEPADYDMVLAELARSGKALSATTRFALAQKAFSHTASLRRRDFQLAYRARPRWQGRAVSRAVQPAGDQGAGSALRRKPPSGSRLLSGREALAGNDCHVPAAAGQGALVQQPRGFRCRMGVREIARVRRSGGVRDRQAREPLRRRGCGHSLAAYRNAFATDPVSAFGGIIAFDRPIDAATLEIVSGAIPRGPDRAGLHGGRDAGDSAEEERARAGSRAARRRRAATARLEAHRRWIAPAERRCTEHRARRARGRDRERAHRRPVARPPVRVARREVREEQRDRRSAAPGARSA